MDKSVYLIIIISKTSKCIPRFATSLSSGCFLCIANQILIRDHLHVPTIFLVNNYPSYQSNITSFVKTSCHQVSLIHVAEVSIAFLKNSFCTLRVSQIHPTIAHRMCLIITHPIRSNLRRRSQSSPSPSHILLPPLTQPPHLPLIQLLIRLPHS